MGSNYYKYEINFEDDAMRSSSSFISDLPE